MIAPTVSPTYQSKVLDHLGLVSGIAQDLGIVSYIDKVLPRDAQSKLSHGQVSLAMLVNGLGFTSRPLYLSPQFFEHKPVERLIGLGIEASDINDYQLGNTLDAIYAYGTSKLFSELSSMIFLQEGLGMCVGHYDTTSMSVHGSRYASDDEEALSITFGYSKDKRSDLRQFVIGLMVEPRSGIPWLFEALDGNTSDKKHFQTVIKRLQSEAKKSQSPMLLIADSALFSKKGLESIDSVTYVTRVPHSYKQAKALLHEVSPKEMVKVIEAEGYAYKEEKVTIFGREMRWLVVYSEQAYRRESESLTRAVSKEQEKLNKALKKLGKRRFNCQADAEQALTELFKPYRYLCLEQGDYTYKMAYARQGRPKEGEEGQKRWQVQASYQIDQAVLSAKEQTLGKFILATNELDKQTISASLLLAHYKNQHQVERGFRFLKNPLCMAEAVFLKNPERIEALAMMMSLALMVYALGERKLRASLEKTQQTIPNQKGKPTNKPTLRWVFQCFEGIAVLYLGQKHEQAPHILNLSPLHQQIIQCFGPMTQKIYGLSHSP